MPPASSRSVTGEARRSLPLTAMAEPGEHGRDGAHAGPADADDVHRRGAPSRGSGAQRAWACTRAATASAASGRPSPPRPCPMATSRSGSASSSSRTPASRRPVARLVGHHHRGPGLDQRRGVGALVVAGRAGQRHQHGRHAGHRELGHGQGSGPAHHHVGGAVEARPCAPRSGPGGNRARPRRRRGAGRPRPPRPGPPRPPRSSAARSRGTGPGRRGRRTAGPARAPRR